MEHKLNRLRFLHKYNLAAIKSIQINPFISHRPIDTGNMSESYKKALIKNLELELKAARRISVDDIAAEIIDIGFNCLICGKCCRREEADNTVIIGPEEISTIQNDTHFGSDDISTPLLEESINDLDEKLLRKNTSIIDKYGNVHTFGWRLCQKENGDCRFIQDKNEGERCTIYNVRPMLCSTYPFYMEDLKVKTSNCEGLGREISPPESHELARAVRKRYIKDIKDTILLYKKYEDFEQSNDALEKALHKLSNGYINYVVHDSKGKHIITHNVKITNSSIDL